MGQSINHEKKKSNKSRIARFIRKKGSASKPEIAYSLKISMPTVLTAVKDLTEAGVIKESGQYESTGGRKAAALSIVPDNRYAVGIDITANHVSFVLINLNGDILFRKRIRQAYSHCQAYYKSIRDDTDVFIRDSQIEAGRILGVGISLPGIIDKSGKTLVKSHILNVENISLQVLGQYFDREPSYENDASAAAMAELGHLRGNAVYLSLSNTVGGAICVNQSLYQGDHFRSAEFGHMILVPRGRSCYCGKKGCMDAYCSAKVLSAASDGSLETFFKKLAAGDAALTSIWEEYLDHLAMAISNLRMCFDCDILLGGYVGGFLEPYLEELSSRAAQYNGFDRDASYIRLCRYKKEAAAVGIALTFVDDYLDNL